MKLVLEPFTPSYTSSVKIIQRLFHPETSKFLGSLALGHDPVETHMICFSLPSWNMKPDQDNSKGEEKSTSIQVFPTKVFT